MKDSMFERAKSWEGKDVPKVDGKGNEAQFPRQTPGDAPSHRPARSVTHVPSNSGKKD